MSRNFDGIANDVGDEYDTAERKRGMGGWQDNSQLSYVEARIISSLEMIDLRGCIDKDVVDASQVGLTNSSRPISPR